MSICNSLIIQNIDALYTIDIADRLYERYILRRYFLGLIRTIYLNITIKSIGLRILWIHNIHSKEEKYLQNILQQLFFS